MRPLGLPAFLALLLIPGLFIAIGLPYTLGPDSPASSPMGWQYRWGDSAVDEEGVPLWLTQDSPDWHDIAFPANPPGREGREKVWFRTTLPAGEWVDPILYITSIDLVAQIYLDEQRIYQHGDFDGTGAIRFVGWPWHMVSLPQDAAGHRLSIRVFSNYSSIGLWGEVGVMERGEALQRIIQRSAWDIAVSALALALALFAAIFAVTGVERRGFGAIALFAGASGLMLLAEVPARQLIVSHAMAWEWLRALSYYVLPVAVGLILAHWLEGRAKRWMTAFWALHLVYILSVVGLVQAGLVSLCFTFPVFDSLLMVSLPIMVVLALRQWRRLDRAQRTIVFSFAAFAPLLLVDILVAHSFLPWQPIPLSYGALAFSLACVAISLRHYHQVHRQLAQSHETLEQEVASRTEMLAQLVEELEGLSYRDALTGIHNRRHFDRVFETTCLVTTASNASLSLLILDIDHFKRVNDVFGHDAGDAVLIEVATLLRAHFRDNEVVCRFGGEEFVVLMPNAVSGEAKAKLDDLLPRLASMTMRDRGRTLGRITLSGGIASCPEHSLDPGELLNLADQALYRAKRQGRNQSVIATTSECDVLDHPAT
ncbi:sensor domain-containing diguanylate cyclase [Salinicola aestuarinus]|uniref:sensor domain-containing diguanylate cyclase n=1 Tax=Salinicola aestuarinus TaxID=1949082 RepID=UPI000DA22E4D|nr:GGDEF domain-containing protein [Salinicola aestuarinus]